MEKQIVIGVTKKLGANLVSRRCDIKGLTYRTAAYRAPRTYDYLSDDKPLTGGELFTEGDTVFVKGMVQFPQEIREDEEYGDYLFLRFHNMGGIVFIDGEPYHGIDGNRDRIALKKEWAGRKKEVTLEIFRPNRINDPNHVACLAYVYFGRVDKKIEKYMLDIRLADEWYRYDLEHPQEDNLYIRKKITAAFEASIQYLDLSLDGEAFREGVVRAEKIFTDRLVEIDDGDVRSHMNLVASTHIDVAWLWQLKDTVRKCGHSFSNMLRLMEEYPEFKFSNSQVKLLAYTKEYYPALYEQIKEAAKAGKWENIGPMWVESDCNMVSGESLVRQILFGVEFLEKEFGSRPKLAWLPDTFGFQANLPQIFKKSGTDYFYSYKLHWQANEKFPYGNFCWKGIDGSEILCSVINNPAGGYNGFLEPRQLRETKKEFEQYGEFDEIIFPYGYGDGGGGPTREMVEYAERLQDFPGMPKCEISTAQEFFDRLEVYREELPKWYGELYIQTHRGTLTSVSDIKKANRHFEMLYQSLEKIGVMAESFGAEPAWDLLHQGWEKGLVLQFHDILPGSSIDQVYEDCREIYQEIFELADHFLESLGVRTAIRPEDGVKVVNTLSWDRDILATFRCAAEEIGNGFIKITSGDDIMPCWFVKNEDIAEVTFLAKGVKALSAKTFSISIENVPAQGRMMEVRQSTDGIVVDNSHYHAEIDNAGRFVSLIDKTVGKQLFTEPGNDVRFFLDGPSREDAWNIYENYKKRQVQVFEKSLISVSENNDLRTVIRVHNTGEKIDFIQDIIFYQDKDRIDFKTRVDWKEKNKVMRVYFPTTMNAPYFTSETGFGAYSRPTVGNTKYEKSKFEVAAHRFVDISENGYGIALLNDSKYAHDVQYNVIGMTLLRSTGYPANYPDMGVHEFTYSLLPHTESWDRAKVAREAIELNAERHTISVIGAGKLAEGLFVCDNSNIVIDTIKPAESGDGIVVRLYESNGTSGKASLRFGKNMVSAVESDLVEKKIKDAEMIENAVSFDFTPYEIKTFIVTPQ